MKCAIRFFLQAVGALTLTAVLATFILLFFAEYWMNVNDPPIQADYILPLAGDKHRIIKSAELYIQGYAPIILSSNAIQYPKSRLELLQYRMGYPNYSREEYLQRLLSLLGAQNAPLEPFGNGHVSTVEEAEALKTHLHGKPVRLLIVTSPYHARRAKMIFENILPNCSITVTSTDEGAFKTQWWKDQVSAQYLVMEFAKTLHYFLGGVYRSTDTNIQK